MSKKIPKTKIKAISDFMKKNNGELPEDCLFRFEPSIWKENELLFFNANSFKNPDFYNGVTSVQLDIMLSHEDYIEDYCIGTFIFRLVPLEGYSANSLISMADEYSQDLYEVVSKLVKTSAYKNYKNILDSFEDFTTYIGEMDIAYISPMFRKHGIFSGIISNLNDYLYHLLHMKIYLLAAYPISCLQQVELNEMDYEIKWEHNSEKNEFPDVVLKKTGFKKLGKDDNWYYLNYFKE